MPSTDRGTSAEEFYRYDPGDGTTRALNLRPLGPYDHPSNLISEELKVKSYDGTEPPAAEVLNALSDAVMRSFGASKYWE